MPSKPSNVPVLRLGFRTFYLLAALFAVSGIALWVLATRGISVGGGYLDGLAWHSHEMLFGFVTAGMAGFLLTAVRNWTGLPTPTGLLLALLALLWLLGRVVVFTGPGLLAAIIDVLFVPALGVAVAVPILRSHNTRNYKILFILLALLAANIAFHFSMAGVLPANVSSKAILFATHVVLLLLAIVGGRVIPAFTGNAIPGAMPRQHIGVDAVAMGGLIAVAVATWLVLPPVVLSILYALAAAAHFVRLLLWEPLKTLGNPLLWMLPAAYLWIPVSLILGALSALHIVLPFTAIHAMTVGAISSMMMAMMMRSTLGHTGRDLRASRLDIVAYLVLQAAAVTRVCAMIAPAHLYNALVAVSGSAWILAFGLYLVHYGPMLIRPRNDGRPG